MNKTNVSPILLVGLFLNFCTLAMHGSSLELYRLILQIIAIVLMCIGLYKTMHNTKN